MSTWGTMVASIRRRCNKAATEDTHIKVAICDAIALLRGKQLRWNQSRFALTLVTDQASYTLNAVGAALATKLPADLVSIVGKVLDCDYTGLATDSSPVHWTSREQMDDLRRMLVVSGEPSHWTFWAQTLELFPPSDNGTNIIRGPYIKDVGTPTYTATTADPPVYSFLKPDGTAMADAFTNAWFDQRFGFHIVSYKAEWDLWTSKWQANAGQDDRAAIKYADYLAEATDVTSYQTSARRVQPYDPD